MAGNHCSVCGKEIDASTRLGKCSLCAIGLTPTAQLSRNDRIAEYAGASGRTLSGVHCPACRAELSMADISKRNCSICGEAFEPETINASVQIRQKTQDIVFDQYKTLSDAFHYK